MKLTLKALTQAARRLSVQAAAAGVSLTAASTQINDVLAAFHMHMPDNIQNGITATTLVLTLPAVVIAAALPQKSVATYNPQTHTTVAK